MSLAYLETMIRKTYILKQITYCKQIGCFSQSFALVSLTYLFKHKAKQAFIITKDLLSFHSRVSGKARPLVKIEERPRLTIPKNDVGASFLSRLFVNHHGWMASK